MERLRDQIKCITDEVLSLYLISSQTPYQTLFSSDRQLSMDMYQKPPQFLCDNQARLNTVIYIHPMCNDKDGQQANDA